MTLRDRWRAARYWIGHWFCPPPVTIDPAIIQELPAIYAHKSECERRLAELERGKSAIEDRLRVLSDVLNADRLDLMRELQKEQARHDNPNTFQMRRYG